MFYALRVFAATSVFLIVSCGGSGDNSDPQSDSLNPARLDTVEFTLSPVDMDTLTLLERPLATGNRLTFPLIAGHLLGNTSFDSLIDAQVDSTNKVEITFDRSIFTDTNKPEMLSAAAADFGLSIQPADTLFGRLGTFAVDTTGQRVPADSGYGLYDDLSNTIFFIAYFNQASVLSGSNISSAGNFFYDIVVPDEGFYAVGLFESQDCDGTLTVTARVIDIFDEAFFAVFE